MEDTSNYTTQSCTQPFRQLYRLALHEKKSVGLTYAAAVVIVIVVVIVVIVIVVFFCFYI